MPAPVKSLLKTIAERLSGSRPGVLRALPAAAIVGIGSAVLTYHMLRTGS